MELKYKEGDVVFVKARISGIDTNDEYFPYEVERETGGDSMWVSADEVFDVTPDPTPAASPTRPNGYPPMKMSKPYYVGQFDDDSSSYLNYLQEWGIEFEVLGFAAYTETDVGPFTSALFRITAVSQMYLDAVAEKQAADNTTD